MEPQVNDNREIMPTISVTQEPSITRQHVVFQEPTATIKEIRPKTEGDPEDSETAQSSRHHRSSSFLSFMSRERMPNDLGVMRTNEKQDIR